jgi:hypothetical protein
MSAVELLEARFIDEDDDCTVDRQLSQPPADPEPLLVKRLVVIPDEGAIISPHDSAEVECAESPCRDEFD